MLLIGSVFLDHPRSLYWYSLQTKYLSRTTSNYSHVVYLNGRDDFYFSSTVIKVTGDPAPRSAEQHCEGLNYILDYFNAHLEYESLLILDSDAFPFRPWQYNLFNSMGKFDIAAVVRGENLDTFAHPSVFFIRQRSPGLKFGLFPQRSLLGNISYDSSCNLTSFYPLVRSNRVNIHPLMCGLYGDFYHHGAGSRPAYFRLSEYHLFPNPTPDEERQIFARLCADPDNFINDMSWVKNDVYSKRKIYL